MTTKQLIIDGEEMELLTQMAEANFRRPQDHLGYIIHSLAHQAGLSSKIGEHIDVVNLTSAAEDMESELHESQTKIRGLERQIQEKERRLEEAAIRLDGFENAARTVRKLEPILEKLLTISRSIFSDQVGPLTWKHRDSTPSDGLSVAYCYPEREIRVGKYQGGKYLLSDGSDAEPFVGWTSLYALVDYGQRWTKQSVRMADKRESVTYNYTVIQDLVDSIIRAIDEMGDI